MTDDVSRPAQYNMSFLWLICLVAAMGGLLFGYDWVVIGGAKAFYEPFFGIDNAPYWQGFAMSTALFGCIVGAMLSGALSDRFGRKRLLVLSGLLFTASALWTALSGNFLSFNLARFLGGVGIGLASNLSPMYIAEISPAESRGRFVSINQLTIVIGILCAQVANLIIAQPVESEATADMILRSWNGQYGWRWMFGAETVPASFFFLLMFFVPESPRWLVKYNQDEKAKNILARIGGDAYAKFEVADIRDTIAQAEVGRVRFADLLEARLFKIVMLGVFLAAFQQWCGINVIFNYAQEVFKAAGYDVSDLMFSIVITGVVNLLFTFVAISTVDRFGRRGLMLIGAAGLAVIYAILGTGFYLQSTESHVPTGRIVIIPFLHGKLTADDTLIEPDIDAILEKWLERHPEFRGQDYHVTRAKTNLPSDDVATDPVRVTTDVSPDLEDYEPAEDADLYEEFLAKSEGSIYMLVLVVAAIACYSMSLAPVTWVVISEIFPNRIRGAAMSVAVLALWVSCTLLTFTFPMLNRGLGPHGAFWLYGAICVVGFFVILCKLPETKGKSLEDIERELVD